MISPKQSAVFHAQDPVWNGDLNACALADCDKAILREFWTTLDNDQMQYCSRCQERWFIICYAITVHKSQSIPEDMIVTDLSCRDFQTGLSYVAVSRVKTLEGLMLDAPFDRNHLVYGSPPDGIKMKMRDQELRKR
ncbi:uncharacterized protein NECHADRAFT_55739 [Fusarium vanettenii 77-13-4]|uniref:ATP-dependent DNA helicase n=1 Tax=Fusarium vanettenii (strain ATCC MYA-4622 / CBS 123669 / FGSC 9596 / NRRL 45880 / 77-13-4) TaxID=660122 RepID=C7ZJK8_FUSV7|nr:uncharacterized protein NECHADRAFT_55739 [Fusarium vanettenii 77-13-4]EEU35808.1 hypothetical protein NECHADRAFT_55739 [Fusarium vanettenii 77-13-4]